MLKQSTELRTVARMMATYRVHAVTHLVLVERRSHRRVGVLSTLDVARALAGFG